MNPEIEVPYNVFRGPINGRFWPLVCLKYEMD
jgi:hypothetical protein